MNDQLTHLDDQGRARMVDVGAKPVTARIAVVGCSVCLNEKTFHLIADKAIPKGDVLNTAKIAGIQAAKKTSELIPLCHPIFLNYIDVRFVLQSTTRKIEIFAEARTNAPTGVEMEALVASQVAAMTIYDMCKAVQRDIEITACRLLYKSGGRSGTYNHPEYTY